MLFFFIGHSQVITNEIAVVLGDSTKLKFQGNDKMTITSQGATVHGTLSTVEIEATKAKIGDVQKGKAPYSYVYEFTRDLNVAGSNGYQDFVFQTLFSSGILVETTMTGIMGPSAATMGSKKQANQLYLYSNGTYAPSAQTIYNLGTGSSLSVEVSPTGSSNQFRVRVRNSHSDNFGGMVHFKVLMRHDNSLQALF